VNEETNGEHDRTGRESAEARGPEMPAASTDSDHYERDLDAFEYHGFEGSNPSNPPEVGFET
jgi:hypothetical protein